MLIGIVGGGFVGKATMYLICNDIQIKVYDINPKLCCPKGTTLQDLIQCEIIFVCVPTPMEKDGSCHIEIVTSVIEDIKKLDYEGFIVVRSTVPVGTCNELQCYFMPEFLTEKNYILDFINNKDWIFGTLFNSMDFLFKKKITNLFDLAFKNNRIKYNQLHFVTNKEAEMIKYFKNCYLATKVAFCNEIFQFCKGKDIHYENVRKLAILDDRIGESHTMVPGHDGKFGFGGTCFPKDMASLKNQFEKIGIFPHIISAAINRNNKIDRPEKDWSLDKGRAVLL